MSKKPTWMIYLDHQHTGKPDKPNDSGAVFNNIKEVDLVDKYIHYASKYLKDAGLDVCVISDGTYVDRHKRVNKRTKKGDLAVYIACHVNAGKGDYSLCVKDFRSKDGESLCQSVAAEMLKLDPIRKSKVKIATPNGEKWQAHAYNTIKGVKPVAMVFEPFFIDQHTHKRFLSSNGLKQVGEALALGIIKYVKSKEGKV